MKRAHSSIDVAAVLQAMPSFQTFCSVEKLHAQVGSLARTAGHLRVDVVGTSAGGVPIHYVRAGHGSVKALVVAFPHCNEPIGGLTVYSLLSVLGENAGLLRESDIEWHIVPCIDPDGALLNEGWSQQPFTLQSYLRHFHRQEPCDQVELSFPIRHKRLAFDRPSPEARILQKLLEAIRPDFYFSLHNVWSGGAYFLANRDPGASVHRKLHDLLEQHGLPLQQSPPCSEGCVKYAPGILELGSTRKTYDVLEETTSSPEELVPYGACSWEYLADIKPDALTFLAELPYLKHPRDGSSVPTSQILRKLKLQADAEAKFVATVILEEWDRLSGELDDSSPFYRKILQSIVAVRERLQEGFPSSPYKTRDVLFNPAYASFASEGEQLNEQMLRLFSLCNAHEFVRLLKASPPSSLIRASLARLEPVFGSAFQEIAEQVDIAAFQTIPCDTLARVQLGSGLVVLDSLLES